MFDFGNLHRLAFVLLLKTDNYDGGAVDTNSSAIIIIIHHHSSHDTRWHTGLPRSTYVPNKRFVVCRRQWYRTVPSRCSVPCAQSRSGCRIR